MLLNLPILLIWLLPLYYAFLSVLTEPLTNFKEFSALLRLLKEYHDCLKILQANYASLGIRIVSVMDSLLIFFFGYCTN